MLVSNKSLGLVTIGATHVPQILPGDLDMMPAEQRARVERRLALAHGEVVLVPGTNEVSDADWMKITDAKTGNRIVKRLIEDRVLLFTPKIVTLKDVKAVDEAIALVKATGDLALLDKWRDEDTRKKVLDAIATQRASIVDMLKAAEQGDGK